MLIQTSAPMSRDTAGTNFETILNPNAGQYNVRALYSGHSMHESCGERSADLGPFVLRLHNV